MFQNSKDFLMVNSNNSISIAVNLDLFSKPIDPILNTTLSNAFYVNNMYGNLVEVDDNGIYKPELASSFYWEDDNLIFEFKNSKVSSIDAEFSLRRAVLNELNDHANLSYLICKNINSEKECIEKIYSKDKKLYINVINFENKTLIIPLLAALNYKIIHKNTFDSNDYKNARIINYSVTTGKYRIVDETFKNLEINIDSIDKYPNAPKKVRLVNANFSNIVEKIIKKEVDVVSTTVPLAEESAKQILDHGWSVFQTYPISIAMAIFTDNGMKKFSADQRFYIGSMIKNELEKNSFLSSKSTIEFLQHFGEGYLSDEQKSEIKKDRFRTKKNEKVAKLGLQNTTKWLNFEKENEKFELVKINKQAFLLPPNEQPDVSILTNDVSFDASFTMFSFAVKSGFLIDEDKTQKQIVEEFISQKSSEDRVRYLNKVHFYSLKNCKIYPIWASPYTTAARPGIEVNMSKYNSRTLLWKLKIN